MRIDSPTSSIISNPTDQKTILLDQLEKRGDDYSHACGLQSQRAPAGSKLPGGAPSPPAMQVQDLGKSMIEGHEVEGKRYVLPAAQKPQMPPMPKIPQVPDSPK